MNSNKVDGKLIAWVYPTSPNLCSSYNESRFPVKMRTKTDFFNLCVAALQTVIQKSLEIYCAKKRF